MEMCRACLATEKEMHPLDENFVIQYNLLTNLNISLLDGMPQYSCKTCLETVKYYIEFRDKSITSEATLREIICSEVKSEDNEKVLDCEGIPNPELNKYIKCEIKQENEDDSFLDSCVTFEEYEENLRNLVKEEGLEVKLSRKKKKIKKHTVRNKSTIIKTISDGVEWFCGLCPKVFEDKIEQKKHIDIHKNDRQCGLCNEKVNSVSQLFAHRLKHMPINQLKCHICAKRYRCCSYLEHHYRNVHIENDDSKLECNVCGEKIATAKKLSNHMRQHSTLNYFCDTCSKGFTCKQNLKAHIQQHNERKLYVCDLCGFSCHYSGGLKDHKIRKHSQKKVICKNCARPFATQQDYDKHNCQVKFRVCTICGLQLFGNSRLSRHMLRHSDVRRYECNRCPAKYKTKSSLIAHIDRHDGNRTKQCEYCPAKFFTAAVLIKHRRIHTGEKPYVCKVCNKGFTGNHNLKVHMKVHGEYLVVKRNTEPDISVLNNYNVTK